MQKEISTRHDIELLVTSFYEKVLRDERLAPVFKDVDWSHHTPVIIDFWSSVLLGDQSYRGNPFQKHMKLPIESSHFDRWLSLFFETLDEHFTGEKAKEAKERAQNIASLFQYRMGLI